MTLAILQWEEKWKAMMSELGKDAKIPDVRRRSALLEICAKDVQEQMMMRLDRRELRELEGDGWCHARPT